ncbi:MAG: LysM peptidoglycan-binding domain-containing protein [Betaproteobacteria bacterium]
MNLNKNLNTVCGGIWFTAGMLLGAAPCGAQAPPEIPLGTHPTAVRVVETSPPPASVELIPAKSISDADLWQRVRRGFVMGELDTPLVQDHEQWYANRPDYIQRFVDRGSKYLYHVVEEVERRGMPTEVALLPIIESAFNPQAYSRAKAAGMWQFIPSTGKNFGLKQDWMADNRRDVLLSTHAALDYLQKLYGMFNSWELAFAAYNCGEGCVARAIQKNVRKGLPTDFLSLNLPPETRNYVPKLIAVKNIVLAPGSYGIELEAVENRPYFSKVTAPAKIDVKLAARLAEMPEDEFASLNPAFNRPVAASGTGYFLVPADKADAFRENMELYRSLDGPLVSWQTANARRGESVETVARRYGLTASYLRATNGSLPEKKGKFTQPASFMVPMHKEARNITATLDRKTAMQALPAPAILNPAARTDDIAPQAGTRDAAPIAAVAAVAAASVGVPAPHAMAIPPAVADGERPPARYQVQSGDTLFSIARRFGVGVEQIKSQNRLSANALQVGQLLRLDALAPGSEAPADAALVRVSSPPKAKAAPRTYTVRNGDSLFAIAVKFGVALEDLMRWNKLSTRTVIQPGLKIRIGA